MRDTRLVLIVYVSLFINWSATKQRLHLQSVSEISRHSVLSGDALYWKMKMIFLFFSVCLVIDEHPLLLEWSGAAQ